MGTLCPSPRVTAPRGEGTVPGVRSLCALASARCCLGIFKGEGLSLGRGRGRCAPSRAPALSIPLAGTFSGETETLQWRDLGADSLRPSGDNRDLGVLGCLLKWIWEEPVFVFKCPTQRMVASEGRLQLGWRRYGPQKGPSHWFQTDSNPAL